MVAERRARLARVTDLVEQQTLHREVEAYEARLARCRHALEKIENRLARLNPLAMERVCHWKMPLTMSNWLSI
ncbi:Primosomal replication protein N'' [Escherichia coli]|uniref:Primosomal replication protein N n=1 Tax=Escherichia coli TaxID=562 RepID=A0A376TKU1_ECOLX|nr:Primosomal replication protein N'' [Escherichia coli]